MFIKLLSDQDVEYCLDNINHKTFKDGDKSAPQLDDIKSNQESLTIPDNVRKLITDRLYDTHYIDNVYCPTRVSVNFYNRYKENDYYNIHIDNFKANPKSNNVFFDYGFSINLTDDYEGGEFIVKTPIGQIGKKLNAGEAIIFPIIYPHGVEKVTKGLRQNVIGWISSNITYEQHFILKNLYEISQAFAQDKEATSLFTKTALIQNYLKKEWGK
tara:strand:- start:3266 stop:3907 length:642 start_codon:yes stop_codon:yes gene_type:complete